MRKQEHDVLEYLVLGKVTGISQLMDAPSRILGPDHRLVGHDPLSVVVLSLLIDDDKSTVEDRILAGLLHIMVDEVWTELIKEVRSSVE